MIFNLNDITTVLQNTPQVLESVFKNLPETLTKTHEGPDTWSPYEVIGHLIHGEKTDWVPRIKIVLNDSKDKTFKTYDRFAQQREALKPLQELLSDFKELREYNLEYLKGLQIQDKDLSKKGMHPQLGEVTLQQLLTTWAVHDLSHLVQINRTIAKQHTDLMGPWPEFFSFLKK